MAAWNVRQVDVGAVDRHPIGLAEEQPRRRVGGRGDRRRRGVIAGCSRGPTPMTVDGERRGAEPGGGGDDARRRRRGRSRQPRIADQPLSRPESAKPSAGERGQRPPPARRTATGPSGPMIDCSWPLPGEQDDVAGPGPLEGRRDRRRPVRRSGTGRGRGACRPSSAPRAIVVEDRVAVLAARVLVGDDDEPGQLGRRSGPSSAACRCRAPPPSRRRRSRSPPRAAASGASRPRTFSSEAGLWA